MAQGGSIARLHVPVWSRSGNKNDRELLRSERAAVRTGSRRRGEHGGPAARPRLALAAPFTASIKPERSTGGSSSWCRLSGAEV